MITLDLRAYDCPLPLLATKHALFPLNAGERLGVQTNRSISPSDFECLAAELPEITLENAHETDSGWQFVFRKA